ncbi:MAG: HAMP domain-containing sensor histidine kinase [Flavobacteriales bacterium]
MARPEELLSNSSQAERLHRFAHDIRNRLAGMQQVLQHLAAEVHGPELRELVEFGEQQQFKALREVELLLDDLGVVRHLQELPCSAFPLEPVVRTVVGQLAHRFGRKQQQVELHVPQDMQVMAHADQLHELLAALLSNASKFAPAGSTVRVSAVEAPEGILVHVRDEGVGLSAEDLANVFQRYAWLSSRSTAGEAQGRSTLARARQWARAMGGDLTAESAGTGAGCTFSLRLRKCRTA